MDMQSRARHFQCLANRLKTENRVLREEKRTLTEEIAYLRKALEDSSLDDLTGLLRRKMFQDIVEQELLLLKRHPGRSLSILIIDINDLKKINARYGHPGGDAVLIAFAEVLKKSLRDCDVVARGSNGADEFLAFLPEQNVDGAHAATMHLLTEFHNQEKNMMPTFYGACIGSATTTYVGPSAPLKTFEELYKEADIALFKQKGLFHNSST